VKKQRLVITGSEGLIGKALTDKYQNDFEILPLDLALGHDLCDSHFVEQFFLNQKQIDGVIILHAINPVPEEGKSFRAPIDTPLSEISSYLDVNVTSAFSVCKNYIANNDFGTIINVSSIYALRAPKHFIFKDFVKPIGYSLSKSSIILMSRYLATYYAPQFRSNTIILGGIEDPSQEETFVERYSAHVPLGRLMHLSEVHPAFDFLLDQNNSYTNGTEIVVDGGWSAW